MPLRKIGVGLGILVFRDGKILLGNRINKRHIGWAPPGGHLEEGESFEEGAARELREETSLLAGGLEVVGVTNDIYPDGLHYVTVFLKAENAAGEPRPNDEFSELKWFDPGALPKPLFLPLQNFLKQSRLEEII
ncbi:MAG: NUDIX domain-containing protein [Candidatus Micrarchaeota archaeon]|nr:NUDIX domain-containing protein [Candidatus Micrarchaeota archaeon]